MLRLGGAICFNSGLIQLDASYFPGGYAGDGYSRWYIVRDHGVGANGCSIPYGNSPKNGYSAANPHLVPQSRSGVMHGRLPGSSRRARERVICIPNAGVLVTIIVPCPMVIPARATMCTPREKERLYHRVSID